MWHRVVVVIRAGTEGDVPRLRQIAVDAKAHWGYDLAQVEDWALGGDFDPESMRAREVYVAEVEGAPVGWASLIPRGEVAWLEDLWIDPPWIGRGVGRLLFEHVAGRARELGASQLEWEAEPNAHGFYERMGATYVRDSEVTEWGRVLDVLGVEL
ncbi:MAG TPA: GNAT family N-acetyltransferase [Gaiellaceae bacterium]|nr:GNAT family N-acetyltransferase [Gaiellaceae bacterium]